MPLVSSSRGFSMTVQIGGNDLPVYQTKHKLAGAHSEGWIYGEPGKIYSITLDASAWRELNTDRHQDLSIHVWVDGVRTQRRALSKKSPPTVVLEGPHKVYEGAGKRKRREELLPYKFVQPRLREAVEDDPRIIGPDHSAIGTIELRIMRVTYRQKGKRGKKEAMPQLASTISEKEKKGVLATVTQFGEAVATQCTRSLTISKQKDMEDAPFCKLTLRYATKAVLQAMEIVPLEAPPAGFQVMEIAPLDVPPAGDRDDLEIVPVDVPPAGSRIIERELSVPPDRMSTEVEDQITPADRVRLARERVRRAREELHRAEEELELAENEIGGLRKRRYSREDTEDGPASRRRRLSSQASRAALDDQGGLIDLTGDD